MTFRIAVSQKVKDARAESILRQLKTLSPESDLRSCAVISTYTIEAGVSHEALERAASRLANPITESYTLGDIPAPQGYAFALEIGYLPGVTDNLGATVREIIEDVSKKTFSEGEGVYSSYIVFLTGSLTRAQAERFAKELHNPLIERAFLYESGTKTFPITVPKVSLHESATADEVDLDVDDEELLRISKEGIANVDGTRRGPLALPLASMKAIKAFYKKQKRKPTDVELEALAQTWSEHCKHTIFADPLDEVKEGIYRRYIKGATERIRRAKGKKDFCVSVFKDNAGAITFDDKHLITHKVETHNSPSGLDPFGGSVTAIVGVNRDCLGFGLGAKPIANTFGFCVADPNDAEELFRDQNGKQQLLPARRILEGVVRGINAGGNESGIPTPLGFVAVDPTYRGKPLVYGGTVGLIPKKKGSRKLFEKKAKPGDLIVMLGGRVGLDGIHGATFSSESLSKGSPATSVQIGDPITQKKLSDALVREARDMALYNSITDNGAGGLSGSVGEMARESGGAEVFLEKVPLKYPGLSPWQIWVSESQERMTLAVPKEKWDAFRSIMERHAVEATVIGMFTKSGRVTVRHSGTAVMDIPLAFLHDGRPIAKQRSKRVIRTNAEPKRRAQLDKTLLEVLARPNVGSINFISQQYDHEVQGSSVTKPMHGRGRVNADAAVLKPLETSKKGVVLSHGYLPWYSQIDTYAMAAASIDTAIRNAVAAGASLEHLAILDNFCWSSSDSPERLHELKRAAKACYDTAVAFGTPFISGKDSMFNDFKGFTADGKPVHIAALPTLLISAIGVIPDARTAQTIDLKRVGDLLYLVGETHNELGGSEYFELLGNPGNTVPHVDAKRNLAVYKALAKAIQKGLAASAIAVGRGGIGVALAKSAVAGQLGADVSLKHIPGSAKEDDAILFSESQGRFLVSVARAHEGAFERTLKGAAITKIGEVIQNTALCIDLPKHKVELGLTPLTEAYRSFFKNW